jgi:hypothetical protein
LELFLNFCAISISFPVGSIFETDENAFRALVFSSTVHPTKSNDESIRKYREVPIWCSKN